MSKTAKTLCSIIIATACASVPLAAQEGASFFADEDAASGTGMGSFFGEEGSPAGGEGSSSPLAIGGEVNSQVRYFIDTEKPGSSAIEAFPEVRLDLDYNAPGSAMTAKLIFSRDKIYSGIEDIIDEAYSTLYFNSFNIETGFMKVVWGKGDELKALDILNPLDYTDFYNKDLLERKKSVFMLKLNKNVALNGLIEFVYIPYYTMPQFDSTDDGRWAPYSARQLAFFAGGGGTVAYDDTDTLEYSQGAVRFTNSAGGLDYGFLYSYGFNTLPGAVYASASSIEVKPERAHIFGFEAAKVILGLNARGEAGYYLTEDIRGNDMDIQNNRIMWVAGFDKDLPLSSLNFLIETQGTYILANSGIKQYDVDYSEDDNYSQNIIIVRLKDSWMHEKIEPQIAASVHIEDLDFMIKPSVTITPKDDFKIEFLSAIFGGSNDTVFGVYDDNDFVQIRTVFSF